MRNRLHKNEATKEEMLALLESRNIGWDFQKNKSTLRSMKADKLQMLYDAVVNCNNLGDISLINPNDMPNADMFTYSSPCFIAGTMVLTDKGFKNIEDIKTGDMVLTHTNTYQKVITPMKNYCNTQVYKINAMCSDPIYTTEEHPFYVRKRYSQWNNSRRCDERHFYSPEWVKAKDLTKDYYVGSAINQKSIVPQWDGMTFRWSDGRKDRYSNKLGKYMDNKDFWWLIGRYIGDGWLCDGYGKQPSCGMKICCAPDETTEITSVLDRLDFNYCVVKERTVNKIQFSSKELYTFCLQFGRGAANKRLTNSIIDLPTDLLEGFIEGYMSADGCYTNAGWQVSSVSRELIYGLAQCVAKVYHRPSSIVKYNRPKTCVIEGRTVNQKDTYTLRYHIDQRKQDHAFYEDGYIWYPIKDITTEPYDDYVYNMEVENDNSYTVQNIIVHNCQSFSLAGKNEGGEWICEDCGEKFNPIMHSFLEICPKCNSFNIKKPTSSLLWECVKIINAKHYPILMMENVKNIVGEKNKPVFDKWCEYLESQGYENHWTILNAKELNVPQNRERMIMISVHKASHWHSDLDFHNFKFPEKMELEYCIRDAMQPEEEVADKFYLAEEIINRFQEQYVGDNVVGTTKTRPDAIGQRALVYNPEKIIGTLTVTDYKQAKSVLLHIGDCEYEVLNVKDKDSLEKILASTPCVVAQRGRLNAEGKYDQCYEPNTTGATNTLTTALKDNYILNESNKSQDIIYVGSLKLLGMLPYCKMHDQCGRIYGTNGVAPTITTMTGGHQEPKIMCCVYSDDEQKLIIRYFTIRKLTPIECGRLMGVPNLFIQRCVDVGLKDSHLYHMFGNSIVTTMLMGVFGELFNVDNYDQKIRNLTASIYKKKV